MTNKLDNTTNYKLHTLNSSYSEFRSHPPTSQSPDRTTHRKRKGPLRSLRQGSSHVPPSLPYRKGSHHSSLPHDPTSTCTGSHWFTSEIDDKVSFRSLCPECTTDIQHIATENFRSQQELSLHLSVPRTRLHLLGTLPVHTRLTDQSSRVCVLHCGRSWRGCDMRAHHSSTAPSAPVCQHRSV